ncbi:MAG: hypothetical protein RLN70_13135 [Rhodospirillaceae bacterium]
MVQIDVLPIEPQQLRSPAARIDRKADQGPQVGCRRRDQPGFFLRREPTVAGLGGLDAGKVRGEVRHILAPGGVQDRF